MGEGINFSQWLQLFCLFYHFLSRNRAIYSHILGFLLILAVRVWFTSFNPIFTDFLYNNMATGIGVALSLYLFFQDWRTPIISSNDFPSSKIPRCDSSRYPGVVVTGLGFGALLFLTLLLFGDLSVISRWAVAPYPDRGPYPYPWRCEHILYIYMYTMLLYIDSVRVYIHQLTGTFS